MNSTGLGINFFGSDSNKKIQLNRIKILKKNIKNFKIFLVIAGTNTSQIAGISAAGTSARSRRKTALADAEFLLVGPSKDHQYKLPFLNAGVTPALISYVCSKLINAYPVVVPLGIGVKPYFDHLIIEDRDLGPSNCLSTGKSMTKERVLNLYEKGLRIGKSSKQPILISESVPGGTTTAQAVMEAFGLKVSNLVGSSLFKAPRDLRRKVDIIDASQSQMSWILPPFWLIQNKLWEVLLVVSSVYLITLSVAWWMFAITWILLAVYFNKGQTTILRSFSIYRDKHFWLVLASISEEEVQKTCRLLDPKCNFEYNLVPEVIENINSPKKKAIA